MQTYKTLRHTRKIVSLHQLNPSDTALKVTGTTAQVQSGVV